MTDAEYAAQKKRIAALSKKWLKPLGLLWWNVEMVYCREGIPQDNPERAAENWQPMARAKVLWPYLRLVIEWNMPEVAERNDDDLERIFVHECCHALVNEMREWHDHPAESAIDHEERVVTMLTNAFLWVQTMGWNDGKADLHKQQREEARSAREKDAEHQERAAIRTPPQGRIQ